MNTTSLFEMSDKVEGRIGKAFTVSTGSDDTITVSWDTWIDGDKEEDFYKNDLLASLYGLLYDGQEDGYEYLEVISYEQDGERSIVVFTLTDSE